MEQLSRHLFESQKNVPYTSVTIPMHGKFHLCPLVRYSMSGRSGCCLSLSFRKVMILVSSSDHYICITTHQTKVSIKSTSQVSQGSIVPLSKSGIDANISNSSIAEDLLGLNILTLEFSSNQKQESPRDNAMLVFLLPGVAKSSSMATISQIAILLTWNKVTTQGNAVAWRKSRLDQEKKE